VSEQPRDDALESELRRLAARAEPVPPHLLRAAGDAFDWRDPDSELAELVFDSLLDTSEAAQVRGGAPQPRLLSFRARGASIEVEVTYTGPGRAVMGQISPPGPARVDIRRGAQTVTVEADELGRFRCEALAAGPVSLRLRADAGHPEPPVVTDWMTI
jgi:hypothetical protein